MKLAVFGAGNMGSALVTALRAANYDVTVWNRTSDKAMPLQSTGAIVSSSAESAASANDCLILSLADCFAAKRVLETCRSELMGKRVIQLTTGKPEEARSLSAFVTEAGGRYLDGAIMGFPNHVGTSANTVLYSGNEDVLNECRDVLEALGAVNYFGAEPGAASAFDIACLMPIVAMNVGLFQALKVC